jgi:hypothetical protein
VGSPTIRVGIVSPAGGVGSSTPDDHFIAGPHCRVPSSASGRVGRAGVRPTIGGRIVSLAGVHVQSAISSTPDDHLTAGPHCRVRVPINGRMVGGCPGIIGASIHLSRYCRKHIISTRRRHCLRGLPFRSGSPGLATALCAIQP